MKKGLIILVTLLLTFTVKGNTGVYSEVSKSGLSGQNASLYGDSAGTEINISNRSDGLFRDLPAPDPGATRPDNGGGIGQQSGDEPLGDGLGVLVVCSVIFAGAKYFIGKHEKG